MKIYFSEFFKVDPEVLEEYGAFNISLINDLPLFIDPFLLFNSPKTEYQTLHENIIRYLRFLRDKSSSLSISKGLLHAWYRFPEVKQNWLGFSLIGNKGLGLSNDFADALFKNLGAIFTNFGEERITRGSHLEKLCLIKEGVGRDKISDFTTNLIKEYLLNYTQEFAKKFIIKDLRKNVIVEKVKFNYSLESWERGKFELPFIFNDFVILTPKDILTKDELWINKGDLFKDFWNIPNAIPDGQLRDLINNYFRSMLPIKPKNQDVQNAISLVINKYPSVLDYYIKTKEDRGNEASDLSNQKVSTAEIQYIDQIKELVKILDKESRFYKVGGRTYSDAIERVNFLKNVIENKDGYRLFYINGKPLEREDDLQILYRLTWFASTADINREVNNGRGPADFIVSEGSKDKTIVEFKLAKNTQLEKNLQKQVEIYQKASDAKNKLKVIIYFSQRELNRVQRILQKLKMTEDQNIVLIDARLDNKPSASRA